MDTKTRIAEVIKNNQIPAQPTDDEIDLHLEWCDKLATDLNTLFLTMAKEMCVVDVEKVVKVMQDVDEETKGHYDDVDLAHEIVKRCVIINKGMAVIDEDKVANIIESVAYQGIDAEIEGLNVKEIAHAIATGDVVTVKE